MKFLVEKICDDLITEQTRDKKYYIKGVFAQAEVKNRNGRSYPRAVMENALSNYMKVVEDRRAIAPTAGSTNTFMTYTITTLLGD